MEIESIEPKLEEANQELGKLQKVIAKAEVKTQEDVSRATEFLVKIKSRAKQLEDFRIFLVKPLNDQVKAINERLKGAIKPFEETESKVKRMIADYTLAEDKRVREEQAALMKKHEKEQAKEEKKAEKLGVDFIATAPPVVLPLENTTRTVSGKSVTSKVWKFTVVDEAAVPRQFCEVSESLIRKAVAAGSREIAGVKIYEDVNVAVG